MTRPGVHGLGVPLDEGRADHARRPFRHARHRRGPEQRQSGARLLEDGLPGANIAQIGLAPFANSREMHEDAVEAGNLVVTIGDVRRDGIAHAIDRALDQSRIATLWSIDCDIDVIDRAQFPARRARGPAGWRFTISSSRCAAWRPIRGCG